jgi:magnesium transporter
MLGSKQSLLLESTQRLLRRGALARVAHLLQKTRPEDIAHLLPLLLGRERRQAFDLLNGSSFQAEVLSELDAGLVPEMLAPMPLVDVVAILHEVPADDIADILALLEESHAQQILERMRDQASDEIEDLMGYDPDSAGGIMSPDFFALSAETTIQDAIVALHEQDEDVEMAFYVYVTSEHGQLVGVVSLRQLVMARPNMMLREVMEHDVITVPVHADQEEVARVVARYNFLAIPVIDDTNNILGIVTVDDIIDVLYEEATEDFLKLAGAGSELSPHAPLREHIRMRYPWLIASCIGGLLAAFIMDPFLEILSQPFLIFFVPVVMGMAGNVGIQSSTIVVRGLATGHIDITQQASIVRREVFLGLTLGFGYGIIVGLGAAGYGHWTGKGAEETLLFFGLSVGLALACAMLIASTLGTLIPITLHRMGFDPAVATGPFVTTALDVLGILAYFGIASALGAWLL